MQESNKEKILKLIKEGKTIREVSSIVGVSSAYVHAVAKPKKNHVIRLNDDTWNILSSEASKQNTSITALVGKLAQLYIFKRGYAWNKEEIDQILFRT